MQISQAQLGALTLMIDAPPEGDVIFMPVNSGGYPGTANTQILKKLGLHTSVVPNGKSLEHGFAFVDMKGIRLGFVVTVLVEDESPGADVLLATNLRAALFALGRPGGRIWLPLMGMGAGKLSAERSLEATLEALGEWLLGGHEHVSIMIAPPANVAAETFRGLQARVDELNRRFQPAVRPVGRGARRKGTADQGGLGRSYDRAPSAAFDDGSMEELASSAAAGPSSTDLAPPEPQPVLDERAQERPHQSSEESVSTTTVAELTDGAAKYGEENRVDERAPNAAPDAKRMPVLPGYSGRAELANDLAASDGDALGTQYEAEAFARIAVARDTKAPLAIGIFGEWGAGKTNFMLRISQHVQRLSEVQSGKNGIYWKDTVEVKFNAWHYTEANLWASLAENIFSRLDEYLRTTGPDGVEKADDVFAKLATPQRLQLECAERIICARRAIESAQTNLNKAHAEVDRLTGDHGLTARTVFRSIARELPKSLTDKQKTDLESAVAESGLSDALASTETLLKTVRRTETVVGRIVLLAKWLWQQFRVLPMRTTGMALFAAGVAVSAWWLLRHVLSLSSFDNFITRAVAGLASAVTFAATIKAFATKTSKALGRVACVAKHIRAEASAAHAAGKERLDVAEKALAEAEASLAIAKQEFERTSPRVRLNEFIRERAGGQGYERHLGLVATIRKDLDQLSQIMCSSAAQTVKLDHDEAMKRQRYEQALAREGLEFGQSRPAAALKYIGRIILYIDDLDRCKPDKVAEVLQAVQLLLAFDLFVVVVAVDYRWVSSALRAYYKNQLSDGASDGHDRDLSVPVADPDDYIEKIFQIPYWVRPVDDETSKSLLDVYTENDRASAGRESAVPARPSPELGPAQPRGGAGSLTGRELTADGNTPPIDRDEPPPEPEPKPKPELELELELDDDNADKRVKFDENEAEYMKQIAVVAGQTPRRLKRFVNVYRLIKATLKPRGAEPQPAAPAPADSQCPDYKAVLLSLALVTGNARTFATYASVQSSVAGAGGDVAALIDGLTAVGFDRQPGGFEFLTALEALGKSHDSRDVVVRMARFVPLVVRFSFCNPAAIAFRDGNGADRTQA
ncbi:P-loop NTPase fold protein [Burkholderia stagnalis]|uniref:P-loop NTPase fold protein n=1 Tax=Burkholderia stagnalis TaxID=1503054 RepID=UPI000B1A001E|nr:P-loop NTPase fold protein [Burkholderia stagnalis]